MNKNDYNSNFKTKVSRSLTDLQNSLDEACRLGLPPHLGDQLHDPNDIYFNDELGYNFKNDLTYKSASNNLQRLISNHEQFAYENEFVNVDHQLNNRNICINNYDNYNLGVNRQTYIDTLRMLASKKPAVPRSQSCETLGRLNILPGSRHVDYQLMISKKNEALECEVQVLKNKLIDMDEEMIRMKNNMFRDLGSQKSADMRSFYIGSENHQESSPDIPEELRKRLDVYKNREVELLNQLNESIRTIEEAKLEEMQALLQVEQLKDDYENMKTRFQALVVENEKKLQDYSVAGEKYFQETIQRLSDELQDTRKEIEVKTDTNHILEEQLKSSKCEIERMNSTIKALRGDKCRNNEDLTMSVTRAVLQRDESMAQSARLQGLINRERSNHAQEKSVLEDEIHDLKHRLKSCENSQLHLTQDKIDLLNANSHLKSEIDQLKLAVQAEHKLIRNETESVTRTLENRIKKLQQELERKQTNFEAIINEAETVMLQQIKMINKLKHEYGSNVHDIDGFVDRHREEVGVIQNKLEHCTQDLQNVKDQNLELQHTLHEYGTNIDSMRTRYRSLEEKKSKQDQEIIEYLSKQNELMKTVEVLTMQIQEIKKRIHDCSCGAFDLCDISNLKYLESIGMM